MNDAPKRTPLRAIETVLGSFELLDGGVIFWTVSYGTLLDEQTAGEAYEAVSALASGDPVAIIGDARGLGFADRTARELLADSEIEGRVATAVIVSNQVIRFLADQYARRVGETRPIRVFDTETDAINWGAEQVQKARQG